MQFAGQRTGQIKTEAIDVHFLNPVSQAVHDQLQHTRRLHVQRVAATGKVLIVTAIVRHQAVIGSIVDSTQRQCRAPLVAFPGVVVDDIQNDFNPGFMQSLHHVFKLVDHLIRATCRGITGFRCEKRQCVVAPVIAQSMRNQVAIIDMIMHGHQFHSRDTQFLQMINRRTGCQSGVSSTQRFRYLWIQPGKSFHMHLIDQSLVPWCTRMSVVAPAKLRIHHDTQRRTPCIVAKIDLQILSHMPDLMTEHGIGPPDPATNRSGVRIQQNFMSVEAMTGGRIKRTMHTIPVKLTGADVGQVNVPDTIRLFLQQNSAGFFSVFSRVEQAQLDAGCMF